GQCPAHHFVHGVVATHVLPQTEELGGGAVHPEEPGGMDATSPVKHRLGFPEAFGQFGQGVNGNPQSVLGGVEMECLADGFDGVRSADTARAGGVDVAHGVRHLYVGAKLGLHHIERLRPVLLAGAKTQGDQLGLAADDALGDQEPGHQVKVVSRSPHRYGEGAAADPDFQGLLGGQDVLLEPHRIFGTCPVEMEAVDLPALCHPCHGAYLPGWGGKSMVAFACDRALVQGSGMTGTDWPASTPPGGTAMKPSAQARPRIMPGPVCEAGKARPWTKVQGMS